VSPQRTPRPASIRVSVCAVAVAAEVRGRRRNYGHSARCVHELCLRRRRPYGTEHDKVDTVNCRGGKLPGHELSLHYCLHYHCAGDDHYRARNRGTGALR
jgi:hypothetical protein